MLDKISELETKSKKDVKLEINDIILSFIEYFHLYVENEIKSLSLNEKGNEVELEEKYEICVENIKRLNELAEQVNLEAIYDKDLEDREEVRKFIQEVNKDIFNNRRR